MKWSPQENKFMAKHEQCSPINNGRCEPTLRTACFLGLLHAPDRIAVVIPRIPPQTQKCPPFQRGSGWAGYQPTHHHTYHNYTEKPSNYHILLIIISLFVLNSYWCKQCKNWLGNVNKIYVAAGPCFKLFEASHLDF